MRIKIKSISNQILTSSLILTTLVGCSSPSFRKKIDTDENDSIRDESFMRYNSNRISVFDKKALNDISKAQAACHEEKFYKGEEILMDKMQQEKNNPFYWTALGTCYYLENKISKANFYYDLGSESLKNYKGQDKSLAEANIENNLGLIHLKFKRFNEAFDSFKKASVLAPNMLTPKINMAQIHLEFNQNERAIEVLKPIESKTRNDVDVLYSLSLAYYRINDFEKSFNYITKINSMYLNRADIVGLYAMNLIKKNRLVDAKSILEKRVIAAEFETRNKIILDNVAELIKEQDKQKKN